AARTSKPCSVGSRVSSGRASSSVRAASARTSSVSKVRRSSDCSPASLGWSGRASRRTNLLTKLIRSADLDSNLRLIPGNSSPRCFKCKPTNSEGVQMKTSQNGYVVETTGLTKRFGDSLVVDGVDLRIPRGSAFGYLGPNGAGKTTLIRMLLGLVEPSSGSMSLLGRPVPAERAAALARVGAIVDEPCFHGHMTGRQNLSVVAAAREPEAHDRIDWALARVGLAERADDRVSKYSMGMRQRLGVASCLLADPELVVLDEPMNGLGPAGMQEFRELIRGFVGEGRTVVLSSHLLDEIERTCDAVAIVDRGRVVVEGSIDELAGDEHSLRLSTSDQSRSGMIAAADPAAANVSDDSGRVVVALRPEASAERAAATISRSLIEAGVDLYELEIAHASLEQRSLEISSRWGEAEGAGQQSSKERPRQDAAGRCRASGGRGPSS